MSTGASPMMSNFPLGFADGLTLRNLPTHIVQPGQVFWVSNSTVIPPGCVAGSNNNRGTWQRPFATIAGALAQCVANRGDIIFVKPGHAESITAAAGIAMNVAGVQVIGLGTGSARPTLTWTTTTAATIAISAAQCAIRNFNLDVTGTDAVSNPLLITAADFHLTDCYIKTATASAQATTVVSTNASSSGLIVNGNKFQGTNNVGSSSAVQIVGGDNIQVTNNHFVGAYGAAVGAISNLTTACTNCIISGNYINNMTAVSTVAISMLAGSTGIICDNRMQILSLTAPIVAAGMSWVGGNYYANAIATAGTLI